MALSAVGWWLLLAGPSRFRPWALVIVATGAVMAASGFLAVVEWGR